MSFLVSSLTSALLLSTLDTVVQETFAILAIVLIVKPIVSLSQTIFFVNVYNFTFHIVIQNPFAFN